MSDAQNLLLGNFVAKIEVMTPSEQPISHTEIPASDAADDQISGQTLSKASLTKLGKVWRVSRWRHSWKYGYLKNIVRVVWIEFFLWEIIYDVSMTHAIRVVWTISKGKLMNECFKKLFKADFFWMIERMKERVNERLSEWKNEKLNECMNEWMNKWMNKWMKIDIQWHKQLQHGER